MATMRGKVSLGMGQFHWSSHQAKWKGSGRMKKFFGDIGAEETDPEALLRKLGGDLLIFERSDSLKLL